MMNYITSFPTRCCKFPWFPVKILRREEWQIPQIKDDEQYGQTHLGKKNISKEVILTCEKIQVTRFREATGSEMLGESTGRDSRALKGGSSSLWSNGLVEVILQGLHSYKN